MRVSSILTILTEILSLDSDIIAFGVTNYGKKPTIYLGLNPNFPPSQLAYPAIVIDSISERITAGTKASCKILIGLLLSNDAQEEEEETEESCKTIEYHGITDSEEFRDTIQQAIMRGQKKLKAKINFEDGGTYSNNVFPIWSGKLVLYLEYSIPTMRISDEI